MQSESLKACCRIFSECFDEYIPASEKIISAKLARCDIVYICSNDDIVAFAATEKNSVVVICVSPAFQNEGYGTQLLNICEKNIISSGYSKAVLGRSSCDLFWGAVINNGSHHFFEKKGYKAYNGCLDMFMYPEDFSADRIRKIYPCPDDVHFTVSSGKQEDIYEAVFSVEPKWTEYFRPDAGKDIILAMRGEKIAGFMTVDYDADTIITGDDCRTGLLGYVGVVPSERNQGIGTNMIAYASELIKRSGCTEAFINYTSLDNWYSRVGFEEYLWFWMGEKEL